MSASTPTGLRRLDKPALLTEFHFGSSDRGPFWPGLIPVAAEAERGPAYDRMIKSVLANPDFVGLPTGSSTWTRPSPADGSTARTAISDWSRSPTSHGAASSPTFAEAIGLHETASVARAH